MLNRIALSCLIASLSLQALGAPPGSEPTGATTRDGMPSPLSVRVNGIPLQVRTATVDMPAESLAEAILAAWRDAGNAGLRFDPSPDRTVLGRQIGAIHETITLLGGASAESTNVVHAANDTSISPSTLPSPPFQLPRGLKITRIAEFWASNKPIVTFTLASEISPAEAVERVRAVLIASQWIPTSRYDDGPTSAMIHAARGSQELVFSAYDRNYKTQAVLEIKGRAP